MKDTIMPHLPETVCGTRRARRIALGAALAAIGIATAAPLAPSTQLTFIGTNINLWTLNAAGVPTNLPTQALIQFIWRWDATSSVPTADNLPDLLATNETLSGNFGGYGRVGSDYAAWGAPLPPHGIAMTGTVPGGARAYLRIWNSTSDLYQIDQLLYGYTPTEVADDFRTIMLQGQIAVTNPLIPEPGALAAAGLMLYAFQSGRNRRGAVAGSR